MNRLVVMSNRVPDRAAGAQAGGLAVALEALMHGRGGLWFGWSGRVSETASNTVTHRSDGEVAFATVDLTPEEHRGYYNGFSNSVLWPLLHALPDLMNFDRRSAQVYRQVNERMAESILPLLRPNDLIWVHDYHLMSMPAMLRARGVRSPIGFFLHVPFPANDLLGLAPEATALLRDLLAADLIGFQTHNDADNFAAVAQRLVGATRVAGNSLQVGARRIQLGVFPVEIEPREFAALAGKAADTPESRNLKASLPGQKLILGVDRLDPTKGLPQRMAGYRRLLDTHTECRGTATFLQIAAVSRQDVASYRELRDLLERSAGAINAEFGTPDWTPLRFLARASARDAVAGYMRQAAVGLVTPLRDGMNLVAKEFVAAQDPQDPGVLVLSRFAGAAQQLTAAVMVNPHDPDEMTDALATALTMTLAERQDRWQAMWRAIEGCSALGWGRSFVASLLRAGLRAPSPLAPQYDRAPVMADMLVARAGQPIAVPPVAVSDLSRRTLAAEAKSKPGYAKTKTPPPSRGMI